MSNAHPTADVEYLVGYVSLEFQREVRAGDVNLGVRQHVVFEAIRLIEVSKGVSIDREEKRTKD